MALMARRDVVWIASVSAIYGLGDPDSSMKMMLHLRRGDMIDQRDIVRTLAPFAVYTRMTRQFTRGTYRVRGK